MRHKSLLLICLATIFFVFGVASVVSAYTFTLVARDGDGIEQTEFPRGGYLYLDITLDDAAGVAGCAFTLNYNDAVLTGPETTTDGTPVNSGEIQSSFPFSFQSAPMHRENAESGKIYFSGATINETTGGALTDPDEVLFTVVFQVKMDAAIGTAADLFSLEQTELWNLDAGYGTDDGDGVYEEGIDTMDPVPVLVGAVPEGHPDWDNLSGGAFPILAVTPTDPLATLGGDIGECVDDDNDGYCDVYETNTGTYVSETDTGTDPDDPDTDHDGYLDGSDAAPLAQDAPGGPGYDPSTDTRTYGISGSILYAGARTGTLYIKAYADAGMTNEIGSNSIATPTFPQSYTLTDVAAASDYYLMAFVDEDGDSSADDIEPDGITTVGISSDMSGSDITVPLKIYFLGSSALPIGQQKTFTLMTEVPSIETLKAYNIEITYDDTYVDLISVTADGLTVFPPTNINTTTPGAIVINALDVDGVAGPLNFGLINVTLEGTVVGSFTMAITVVGYGEDGGNQFPPVPVDIEIDTMEFLCGDADGIGGVDIFDALMVAEYDVGLIQAQDVPGFSACNVDGLGSVDIFDALMIAEYDVGIVAELDCGQ
ncbi:hypothetical protein ACFL5W_01110 [Thermodesulfobacteriota bacterium]